MKWSDLIQTEKWNELIETVNEKIFELQMALESCDTAEEMKFLQGEINSLRWFLGLPEVFIQEEEEEQ